MRALLRPSLVLRLALLAALGAGGCVSASGAYRDGMAAETSGDYDAAVARYATALRRDAALPNARGRLVVAAREGIRRHLAVAAVSDATTAADAWLAADALVAEARSVGVDAERPPSFADGRDRALDAGVYALLAEAAADVDRRDYPGALARLESARRYRPSRTRQAELDATARTATHYWAEDDLAAGRFRDALAHTDAALALGGPDADGTADLLALRDEVLLAGTRRVAVLPADGDAYPRRWLPDLDDTLDDAVATAGAPFLVYADPADVRRAVRERGAGTRYGPVGAARVADRVGAELAVLVRLDAPDEAERVTDRRRVSARLRGSRDTTSYVRETVEYRVTAIGEVTVVDARTARAVCEREVRESATESTRVGRFRGTWTSLDLDRGERALFDDDGPGRATDQAFVALRERVAARAAEHALACLARQIP